MSETTKSTNPLHEACALHVIKCIKPYHYYFGISKQPDYRLKQHQAGLGSKFTEKHGVLRMTILRHFPTRIEALKAERAIVRKAKNKYPNYVIAGAGWH